MAAGELVFARQRSRPGLGNRWRKAKAACVGSKLAVVVMLVRSVESTVCYFIWEPRRERCKSTNLDFHSVA